MAVIEEMESTYENFIEQETRSEVLALIPLTTIDERAKKLVWSLYEAWRDDHEAFKAAIKREDAKGTMDIASDADRAWFEANPRRKHRLRAPMRGEAFLWQGDLTRICAVVVKKVAPGVRARVACDLTKPLEVFTDDEHTAKQLWKELERNRPQVKAIGGMGQ